MPPLWLVHAAVVALVMGLVALPLTAVFGWLAIKFGEWYWDHQERHRA